jgi:hypothetical protein
MEMAASFDAVGLACASRDLEQRIRNSNVRSEKIEIRLRTGHTSICAPSTGHPTGESGHISVLLLGCHGVRLLPERIARLLTQ